MNSINLGYVVVEGPIGVGKTSLVRRLAEALGNDTMLEKPEENPFLERFYQSRRSYALPAQLYFLFQRVRQIEALRQGDMFRPGCVADFMLEKDNLFARVNLDDDELRLYEQVYNQLQLDLPAPDLVIYLQAPVEVLLERIRRRGLAHEMIVERDYLQALNDAYTRFFYQYSAAPLLVVNASEINLVDNDEDFETLLAHIRAIGPGRHFFNPLSNRQ